MFIVEAFVAPIETVPAVPVPDLVPESIVTAPEVPPAPVVSPDLMLTEPEIPVLMFEWLPVAIVNEPVVVETEEEVPV